MNHKSKLLIIFFLVFNVSSVISAANEQDKTNRAEKYYVEGLSYFQEGNYLKALDVLLLSLDLDKNQPRVNTLIKEVNNKIIDLHIQLLYKSGVNHFNNKKYIDAIEALSEAHALNPGDKDIDSYLKKSRIQLEKDTNEKQHFLNISPAQRLIEKGDNFNKNKEYLKAFDLYNKVYSLEKVGWWDRMKINRRISKMDKIMRKVIDSREDYEIEQFHYAQAYMLYRNGKIDEAVIEWEKVLALNANNTEVTEYLYKNSKGDQKAQLKSLTIKNHITNGIEFYNAENYEKAIESFENALEIDKTNTTAQEYLDNSIQKLKKRSEEEELRRQKALLKQTEEKEKMLREKRTADEKRKKEASEAEKKRRLEKSIKQLSEKEIQDMYNKGLRAYALGNLNDAIKIWDELLIYDPNNEKVKKNLERTKKELENR
ncbi:MAG: hypothetical protein ABH857_01555 [Elusimicrobiota bacterium]